MIRGVRISNAGVTASATVVGINSYSRRRRQGMSGDRFPACDAGLSAETCLPGRERTNGAGGLKTALYMGRMVGPPKGGPHVLQATRYRRVH